MRKLMIAIFALMLATVPAFAMTANEAFANLGSGDITTIMATMSEIEKDVTLKNAVSAELDKSISSNSMLQRLVPKGRIKIDLVAADGTVYNIFVIIGNDGKVQDLGPGVVDQWAYYITVNEAFLQKIGQSSDPANTLITALQNKELTIKAKTVVGKIKISILGFAAKLAALFGFGGGTPAPSAPPAAAEICPFACEPPFTLFGPQTTPGACFVNPDYANKVPVMGECPGELILYGPNSKQGCGCQPVKPNTSPCPARCDTGTNSLGERTECVFEGNEMEGLIGKTGVYCVGKTLTNSMYKNQPPVVCTC